MNVKGVENSKLNRLVRKKVTGTTGTKGAAGSSSAVKAGYQTGHDDDVSVSSDARVFGMAGEAVHSAPEIRTELVESIREALSAGRYSVSSLDVADKILRQVLVDRKRYS